MCRVKLGLFSLFWAFEEAGVGRGGEVRLNWGFAENNTSFVYLKDVDELDGSWGDYWHKVEWDCCSSKALLW